MSDSISGDALRGHLETMILSVLEQGDVFGEMTLIDSNPRSATARALDDCALLPI